MTDFDGIINFSSDKGLQVTGIHLIVRFQIEADAFSTEVFFG